MKISTAIAIAASISAAMIVLVQLSWLEQDAPQGPVSFVEGRIVDCRKPVGRYATNAVASCVVRLDDGSELSLWSPELFESGRRVKVGVQHRRHTGRPVFRLDEQ